jgi:hypothetical protein
MRKIVWGVFIMVLCLGGAAFAGDTQSLPVSCTIPAIPGVNVPLIVQEREEPVKLQAKEESARELVQQDSRSPGASIQMQLVRVQTFYAR